MFRKRLQVITSSGINLGFVVTLWTILSGNNVIIPLGHGGNLEPFPYTCEKHLALLHFLPRFCSALQLRSTCVS